MKSNQVQTETTLGVHELSSSSRRSSKKPSVIIKVSSIRRWRVTENRPHSSTNMNIDQYHRRLQPFTTQRSVEWSKFTSAEPVVNAWEIGKPNDNRMKTDTLNKKHNQLTHEILSSLSSKTCLHVQSDIFPSISFKSTNSNFEYGQSFDHKQKKRKKRKNYFDGYYCCSCSLLSMLLILVGIILLGTAIAAIILGILMRPKTTTMSTSTSAVTTSSLTTVTTTTTSATSTTTITTTTTTSYVCNSTCLNQTWQSSSNLLSEWLFDATFNDKINNYNATPSNNVSFTTNGYVQQAVVFTVNASQMLTAPHMPLSSTSFTIETWLYITGLLNILDHSIFGLCPAAAAYQCLHLTIRQSSSNYYLYLGFYSADCQGSTPLTLNTWIHAAFVFDMTAMKQRIYLNGVLDMTCSVSSAVTATSGGVTIGYIPTLAATSVHNYFQGYIDQLTVSTQAKPSCEILEDATLAAYFTFDSGLLLNDSGPNSLQATTQSTSTVSSGHFAQAITLSGSSSSYFQMSDLTMLGISNRSFSISLWIRPVSLSGILVHVSSSASGLGWCLPFIGFATNGSIVAQMLNSNGAISVVGPSIPVATSTWSHIVQTWSSTNGLRLYIDNILVASRVSLATIYTASTISNYVTLGNTLAGTTCFQGQMGTLTPYQGDIDDYRIYTRELNAADVCTLFTD